MAKRTEWKFKYMAIGDQITIPKELAVRAQAYCHVYARQAGKKFATEQQEDRSMRITRIG